MNPAITPDSSTLSAPRGLNQPAVWLTRRKIANGLMWAGTVLATLLVVIPLLLVLYYLVIKGIGVLNWEFFTRTQRPIGEAGGGMKHAIAGSLILIGLASCIGLPFGVFGGLYLAEYGNHRFGWWLRFSADVLNGVPSIVVGIFVYAIAVRPVGHFSAYAGGLALGIMMVPVVMRTTEEIVRLVPRSMREAALALGDTHWHTVFKVVLSAAKGGIVTGVLLAVARVAGETAPLLFTALGNDYMSLDPSKPIAALPVKIYQFATAADDRWNALAWGAALVLVLIIFILSVAARYFTRGAYKATR